VRTHPWTQTRNISTKKFLQTIQSSFLQLPCARLLTREKVQQNQLRLSFFLHFRFNLSYNPTIQPSLIPMQPSFIYNSTFLRFNLLMFLHLPRAKTTREKNESPTCFVSNSKLVSPYFLLLLQLYYTLADTIMSPPFFSRCSSSSQGGGGSMHFPGCPYIEYIQNNNILWGFSWPTTHLPRPFLIFFNFFQIYYFLLFQLTSYASVARVCWYHALYRSGMHLVSFYDTLRALAHACTISILHLQLRPEYT